MSHDKKKSMTVQQRIQESLQEVVVEEFLMDPSAATGYLFNKVKKELDKLLKETDPKTDSPHAKGKHKISTHDDKPIILDRPLKEKEDLEVVLDSGAKVCIRFLPNRPGSRQITEGVLFRIALPDNPNEIYNVRARQRPYTDLHVVLSNPTKPQYLDLNRIKIGLFFLKGLGKECSGFFNAAAPSYSKFHYQFFGELLPLWKNIKDKLVFIANKVNHPVANKVEVGILTNWPFKAKVLSCDDLEELAKAIWWEIEYQRRNFPYYVYDLLMSIDDKEVIHVVLALRRGAHHAKPESFYPEKPEAYGDFGGLELCGLIVTIKEADVFKEFKQSLNKALNSRLLLI